MTRTPTNRALGHAAGCACDACAAEPLGVRVPAYSRDAIVNLSAADLLTLVDVALTDLIARDAGDAREPIARAILLLSERTGLDVDEVAEAAAMDAVALSTDTDPAPADDPLPDWVDVDGARYHRAECDLPQDFTHGGAVYVHIVDPEPGAAYPFRPGTVVANAFLRIASAEAAAHWSCIATNQITPPDPATGADEEQVYAWRSDRSGIVAPARIATHLDAALDDVQEQHDRWARADRAMGDPYP